MALQASNSTQNTSCKHSMNAMRNFSQFVDVLENYDLRESLKVFHEHLCRKILSFCSFNEAFLKLVIFISKDLFSYVCSGALYEAFCSIHSHALTLVNIVPKNSEKGVKKGEERKGILSAVPRFGSWKSAGGNFRGKILQKCPRELQIPFAEKMTTCRKSAIKLSNSQSLLHRFWAQKGLEGNAGKTAFKICTWQKLHLLLFFLRLQNFLPYESFFLQSKSGIKCEWILNRLLAIFWHTNGIFSTL